ncbi:MAG: heme exporter protein CcmD [Halioglobus sp.]|jgi:heme exporter protein D
MYFDSLAAALAMDGHGAYVWSAYAVTLLVLAFLLIAPGRRRRRLLRDIDGELKRRTHAPTTVGEEA